MKHRLTLVDGTTIETDLEASPLLRFWRWTEYRWRPYRGRQLCECMSEVVWCQDFEADHRVLTLGYFDVDDGGDKLVIAVPDGRIIATSPHCVLPILDDELALDGVDEAFARLLESCAAQPSLF